MREIVGRDETITREVWERDAAIAVLRRHRRALQGRVYRRDPARRGDQPLPPGRFRRSLRRPASALDRPSRPGVQADERGRRLLAGRRRTTRSCSASTAPPGPSQKELDQYLFRLEEAERRDHRRIGRELDLFHLREEAVGSVFWHPNGWKLFRIIEAYMRRPARCRRLPGGQGPAAARPQPVGSDRPLGEFPREHVHRREPRRAGARGQADELPGPCADLPQPAPQLPRIAAAPRGIRQLPPQRAVGRAARHHAGARLHPGRRAHLLHRGPDHRGGDRVLPAAVVDLPRFRLRRMSRSNSPTGRRSASAATRSGTTPSRICAMRSRRRGSPIR